VSDGTLRRIDALMLDKTIRKLHTYDPNEETWMQFEFDGLKMMEAAELIKKRTRVSEERNDLYGSPEEESPGELEIHPKVN
jgi:hypothetical protein